MAHGALVLDAGTHVVVGTLDCGVELFVGAAAGRWTFEQNFLLGKIKLN